MKNAIYDVVTAHFNSELDGEEAAERLVAAIKARCPAFGLRAPPREPTPRGRPPSRAEVVSRPRMQNLPRWSRPNIRAILVFIYGFMLWTVYVSFTNSRILPFAASGGQPT